MSVVKRRAAVFLFPLAQVDYLRRDNFVNGTLRVARMAQSAQ